MFNRSLLILSFIFLISCTKEIIQQKLTVSVTPANGGSVSPPSNSYEKGSNVSLVATPTGEYLFKQWQGSQDGYSKGRERSFHFGNKEHHICGMISHLGPQLAIADGVALAHKLRKEKKISLFADFAKIEPF